MTEILRFLNTLRRSLGLKTLTIMPSLDHCTDLPRTRSRGTNPLHVILGLALHGRVGDWWLEASADGVEIRFGTLRTFEFRRVAIPAPVWAQLCAHFPNACSQAYLERQSQDTIWGLPQGKAGRFPEYRQKNQSPFDLLS